MSRTVGKSLLPADVEELIHRLYPTQYASKIKYIYAWSKALDIIPTRDQVTWDNEMWRMGTPYGKQWDNERKEARPKEAEAITFDKPSLIQCPICKQNMVVIEKMIQKRGCDEPQTVYCTCKNPECKKRIGREHRFRTEG